MNQIDVVLVEDAQRFGQGAARIVVVQREDQARAGGRDAVLALLDVGAVLGEFGLFVGRNERRLYMNSKSI